MEDTERFVWEIASAKSWSLRGAFPQPAFIDSRLTISYMSLPCLPSIDELTLMFFTLPSHSGATGVSFDVFKHMMSMI